MSADQQRIVAAVMDADRTVWHEREHAKLNPTLDLMAEMLALLHPRPSPAPTVDAAEPVPPKPGIGPLITLPPYPVTEVHEFQECPVWSWQPIGKTVATGEASSQWQGAVTRPKGVGHQSRGDEPAAAPVTIPERVIASPAPWPPTCVDATPHPPVSTGQKPDPMSTGQDSTLTAARLDQADFDAYLLRTSSSPRALKRQPVPAIRSDSPKLTLAAATSAANIDKTGLPATLTPKSRSCGGKRNRNSTQPRPSGGVCGITFHHSLTDLVRSQLRAGRRRSPTATARDEELPHRTVSRHRRAQMTTAGLAGALGRSGRGAPKSGAPGWGAGRCKISGALRFKTDLAVRGFKPAISSFLGCALRNCTFRQLFGKNLKQSIYKQL